MNVTVCLESPKPMSKCFRKVCRTSFNHIVSVLFTTTKLFPRALMKLIMQVENEDCYRGIDKTTDEGVSDGND